MKAATMMVVKTSRKDSTHMWITHQRQKSAITKLVCGVATKPAAKSSNTARTV